MRKRHEQRVLDHFAANVTARRLDAGLTQGQFAELIDRDVRFVRMLEGAKSAPSFATICTIAHVLDLEVARLFVPAERPIVLTGRPRKTKK